MALWDHVRNGETKPARSRRAPEQAQWRGRPAFLRRAPIFPGFSNDNARLAGDDSPALELDCLRHVLAPDLLRSAEARSRELGIGADQVLIQWGVIDEAQYLRHLAFRTGVSIETFEDVSRADVPLRDRDLAFAATHGLIPIRRDDESILILAPRNLGARRLSLLVARYHSLIERLRLAPAASLQQFLMYRTNDALGRAAAEGLRDAHPELSAAPDAVEGPRWRQLLQRIKGPCGFAALLVLPPIVALDAWSALLALWFLAFIVFRLWGSFMPRTPQPELRRLPDHRLPVYTVIAALYREAKLVGQLMQAIDALDYPREKLQVIIAIEPDDLATRAAIARLGPMPHVQVLIASTAGPQTKPKALNCALPFARGSFTAVFDAEDRPDPGQLRAALDAFRSHDTDVACAQASLCIDNNNKDSWLSRGIMAQTPEDCLFPLSRPRIRMLPKQFRRRSSHARRTSLQH
jgi:hypothetical protein